MVSNAEHWKLGRLKLYFRLCPFSGLKWNLGFWLGLRGLDVVGLGNLSEKSLQKQDQVIYATSVQRSTKESSEKAA